MPDSPPDANAGSRAAPEQIPLLITVSGRDRPGLAAGVFAQLRGEILDVEQSVVSDRLVLMILLMPRPGDGTAQIRSALAGSGGADVEVEVNGLPDSPGGRRAQRRRLVVLAATLRPRAVAALAEAVRDSGGSIERISRIADNPVTAVELIVRGGSEADLVRRAARVAADHAVDISTHSVGLDRFGRRLVVLDVDSTLIRDEVIELLARHTGTQAEVAEITERAMRGELDFRASLTERAALLAGAPATILDEVRGQIRLTPGARTLCRTLVGLGHEVALVSGGFTDVIAPLAAELGVSRVRANTLEVVDGVLTGRVVDPVVDRQGKAAALREFAADVGVPLSRTVAIGDGANDLDMLAAAGLGVAFNAKPVLREAADAAVNVPFLDSVLFLLGIPREDIEAAQGSDAVQGAAGS